MARRGILFDATKCVGCGACTEGCQEANKQPKHEAKRFDENTFTFLMERGKELYVRRLCMHCQQPTCASVCPVGALRKTAEGPVTYDPDKCMGCRYCMAACPFGVPAYEWRSATPRIRKCEMCHRRGAKGPACAEACSSEATLWGPRDKLLADAKKRLADDPKTYHPTIYGLHEAGGTDVLIIGPRGPIELGLPGRVVTQPLPELTWSALKHVPDVVLFGAVVLGGLHWLTRRKEEVARVEGNPTQKEDHRDR
jgi:formate dehydrogenase iron-sulfur subunit